MSQGIASVMTNFPRQRILQLAQAIEPSAAACLAWYYNTVIMELDGRTADQLVQNDEDPRVARFLLDIINGLRE